ncbi:MAG: deoxyribodipyrimidine photo-lyase, partial [Frankiaceae bacterium]|nr:deoxyribodipyrimidine photo-lyase [Frankiaceae bacterium]
LADLDRALKHRGGHLVNRAGDVAAEVARVARQVRATSVHISADYSRYAVAREHRLREALGDVELRTHHGHVLAPPGAIRTGSGEAFSVFSPYHRKWLEHPLRRVAAAPTRIKVPDIAAGDLPTRRMICAGPTSPDLVRGGETEARRRAKRWLESNVADYDDDHDAVARDNTSRLSPYLHFGCISPVELVARADRRKAGVDAFVRQLCWRDFYHQVLADNPAVAEQDWRTKHDHWNDDDESYQAWKDGRTGYPLVDAGMRQLRQEGWMHNRARLVTASFLTKHLYIDWRLGAAHFFDLLLDGDIANNSLNWQWVAGTGTDSRPNRMFNPTLQQERYDPDLQYVKKYVEEFGTDAYPEPIVDHKQAVAAFRAARGKGD